MQKPRYVYEDGDSHYGVYRRLEAGPVPIMNKGRPYRPEQLKMLREFTKFYEDAKTEIEDL